MYHTVFLQHCSSPAPQWGAAPSGGEKTKFLELSEMLTFLLFSGS